MLNELNILKTVVEPFPFSYTFSCSCKCESQWFLLEREKNWLLSQTSVSISRGSIFGFKVINWLLIGYNFLSPVYFRVRPGYFRVFPGYLGVHLRYFQVCRSTLTSSLFELFMITGCSEAEGDFLDGLKWQKIEIYITKKGCFFIRTVHHFIS